MPNFINGHSFSEILNGTSATDYIFALGGNDTVNGLAGNDVLFGGDGVDKLFGGTGGDILDGGAGNDLLDGGTGNDALYGGAGIDTVSYANAASGGWTIQLHSDSVGPSYNVAFNGLESDTLSSIENLTGSAFGDTIEGGDGANNLFGLSGGDVINGRPGNDYILGGDGNDTCAGDRGSDVIYGGAGNDYLFGGYGDAYDYEGGDIGNSGTNDTIYGGVGDDYLRGCEGDDRLVGGDGNDGLSGGSSNDTITLGAGNDTVYYSWENEYGEGDRGKDLITDFDRAHDYLSINLNVVWIKDGPAPLDKLTFPTFDSNHSGVLDDADAYVAVTSVILNGVTHLSTVLDVGAAAGDVANVNTLTVYNVTDLHSTDFL